MAKVYRSNRKVTDEQIIRLNACGLSLLTMAQILNCHTTTITARLEQLGISVTDTRRSFMEDILKKKSAEEQNWIADQLSPELNIKQYISNLLTEQFVASKNQERQHVRNSREKDEYIGSDLPVVSGSTTESGG